MNAKFRHANIISPDWKALADFYCEVFGCEKKGPLRCFSGSAVSLGTGVPNAVIEGIHLALPGEGPDGPTLEIFSYNVIADPVRRRANTQGFAHIAFEVSNVSAAAANVVAAGGQLEGQIVRQAVANVGEIQFVYVRDPDGNLIELQSWITNEKETSQDLDN